MVADIAQFIGWKHKMVAGIDVAVMFHDAGMSAMGGIGTNAGGNSHPVGKCTIEDFHENTTYIVAHPLIEYGAEESAPLFCSDGEIGNRYVGLVGKTCQGAPVGMGGKAFDDGGELQILATMLLKKMVELQRMVGIIGIDHRHGVPFHMVLVEQTDAVHHSFP